jgi:hypothetical protein
VQAEDVVELQGEQIEELVSQLEQQIEDPITKPNKKSEQHAHKKKFSIKPGMYKLIVDQLDELQQLQSDSSTLALATQKSLDEHEQVHQQVLELLQANFQEKTATLEATILLQQAQLEALTAQIDHQSTQLDQYKISLADNVATLTQRIHLLEKGVTQSQHDMDRNVKTLRGEVAHQKEQIHTALHEARQEIQAQALQQHNEHQVEIHTLGEQVNNHIINLNERLNETTEQIQKELHAEIDTRKQLAKQVTTLSSSRQAANNRQTTRTTTQPAATPKEEQ